MSETENKFSEAEKELTEIKQCLEEAETANYEAQNAKHETDIKLSNLEKTSSQLKMELNKVLRENKDLKKKLEQKSNQSGPSTPSITPIPSSEADLNENIKVRDVTITRKSKKRRSGFLDDYENSKLKFLFTDWETNFCIRCF